MLADSRVDAVQAEFSWERTAERYLQVFREVLQGGNSS